MTNYTHLIVTFIRFWLVDCPFCANTASSLVEFHNNYKDKGLVVLGIHHPKSEKAKDVELVKKRGRGFGFEFQIAQDNDWKTINSYWLGGKKRSYTSSSILIDKKGLIQFIHEGGEFFRSDSDLKANAAFEAFDKKIQELIEE